MHWDIAEEATVAVLKPGQRIPAESGHPVQEGGYGLLIANEGNGHALVLEGSSKDLMQLAARIARAVGDIITGEADNLYARAFGSD